MITALPSQNQTQNIGCGVDATHTTGDKTNYITESIPKILTFPLCHHQKIERSVEADALIDRLVVRITLFNSIKLKTGQIPVFCEILKLIKKVVINV